MNRKLTCKSRTKDLCTTGCASENRQETLKFFRLKVQEVSLLHELCLPDNAYHAIKCQAFSRTTTHLPLQCRLDTGKFSDQQERKLSCDLSLRQ